MSDETKIGFIDNPDFNRWLEENYQVRIEEYEYPSIEVLYNTKYEDYVEALNRYITDPRIELSRIEEKFPSPIAYYFYQANNNYQNDHHRLDLLKSCWEAIVFLLFGLVVAEARHKKLPIKAESHGRPFGATNSLTNSPSLRTSSITLPKTAFLLTAPPLSRLPP